MQGTYAVNVARSSLPLRIAVATIFNLLEVTSHVVVDASVLAEVKLVAVVVRILSRSMANLRAASDDERALACILQGDGTIDSGGIDLVI